MDDDREFVISPEVHAYNEAVREMLGSAELRSLAQNIYGNTNIVGGDENATESDNESIQSSSNDESTSINGDSGDENATESDNESIQSSSNDESTSINGDSDDDAKSESKSDSDDNTKDEHEDDFEPIKSDDAHEDDFEPIKSDDAHEDDFEPIKSDDAVVYNPVFDDNAFVSRVKPISSDFMRTGAKIHDANANADDDDNDALASASTLNPKVAEMFKFARHTID
jgi:hypothetical protein